MNVLLIQPPIEDFYQTDVRLQPLGLAYLKSAVETFCPDVSVTIRDFHQGRGRKTIAVPAELNYLKPYYCAADLSPFRCFYQYYHFGAGYDEIRREIADLQPDVVGISSLFSPYYREVLKTAQAVKEVCSAPVVVGGSHVSCAPEMMLKNPAVDYAIIGEGERPLVALLRYLTGEIQIETVPNLGYKLADGTLKFTSICDNFPLDTIPRADFSNFPPETYKYKNDPLAFVMTSRGCPHHCSFCSVHKTFTRHHRRRKPEDIVAEIKSRYQDGYRVFDFEDDNLTLDRERISELCQLLIAWFPAKALNLQAMNGISYRNLDKDLLSLMRKAGFQRLDLALVSANEDVLRALNRPHRLVKFKEIVASAFELGFSIEAHQILGLPQESRESMIKTLILLAGLPVRIGVSIFYLTPGTSIAAHFPPLDEVAILKSRSTAMANAQNQSERDFLYTLFFCARITNFLKELSSVDDYDLTLKHLLNAKDNFSKVDQIGLNVLERLFNEQKLYAFTRQGYKVLSRFDFAVFNEYWTQVKAVRAFSGQQILI